MTQDECLYALACYKGEEPDWKQAYKQAYETCQAQQAKIDELEPLERRLLHALAEASTALGRLEIEVHSDDLPNGLIKIWTHGHFYNGSTISEAIEKAIVGVREEEAAKARESQSEIDATISDLAAEPDGGEPYKQAAATEAN